MKLHVLFALVTLHGAFTPRFEGKAINGAGFVPSSPIWSELKQSVLPVLERLGEEYFIRLNNPNQYLNGPEKTHPPRANTSNRALQLMLTQQSLLRGQIDDTGVGTGLTNSFKPHTDSAERKRRAEDPPISLDLTFHLLREVLQMARAEQLAQQASSNRRIMDFFGK
ncbi:corticoliberin [Trichomycterus rosablanca]|uniref:corticoliberin n=1 Tax=Trichomycterus rosablanca TaxID=2290929 RepID=UPI002F35D73B